MSPRRRADGFTLLEVLVATAIMAFAVAGLMGALSTSLRNSSRLTDHDRAAMLARAKMDEILLTPRLPKFTPVEGQWDRALTSGFPSGWRATVTPFEVGPTPSPGSSYLERIQLEVWWDPGDRRRTFTVEAYRRAVFTPEEINAGVHLPR